MKKILITLIIAAVSINTFSQIVKQGVLNNSDTVVVLAATTNSTTTKYYVQSIYNGAYQRNFVPERRIKLLPDSLNYWENIWFKYATIDYYQNKGQYTLKSDTEAKLLAYLGELENNDKLYYDPYVEDYISQLINRIYTEKIKFDDKYINITPKLINNPSTKVQPLANGFLLIGIDFLSKLESEETLINELTKGIAHIILKHGVININKDSYYGVNPLGLTFNSQQSHKAKVISREFIKLKRNDSTILNYFLSEKEFISKLSGIINYVAWQEYFSNHIESSVKLLNKLIKYNLALEETYFLKAKILRQNNNSYSTNMQALDLLEKAEANRVHGYRDIYKERGLIMLRLGRVNEANEAFLKYKSALNLLDKEEQDPAEIKWCNIMLYRCAAELNKTANLN